MTDENDSGRPSPTPGARAPLTLKPRMGGAVSAGMVKQSFSHGRSKTVVVETKRRRVDAPGASPAGGAGGREGAPAEAARAATAPRPAATKPTAPGQTRTYEPGRERRDDRPTTTTYRPERPSGGVAFNQRAARSDDSRAPRDDGRDVASGQRDRPARPRGTVRYSAT